MGFAQKLDDTFHLIQQKCPQFPRVVEIVLGIREFKQTNRLKRKPTPCRKCNDWSHVSFKENLDHKKITLNEWK